MLANLARWCYRHRAKTLGAWILGVFLVNAIGWGAIGPDFKTDFKLPASETRDVFDYFEANSPEDAGLQGQIVFTAPQGVDDPAVRSAMEGIFAKVAELEGVRVSSPYDEGGDFRINGADSSLPPGTVAYAQLDLTDREFSDYLDVAEEIESYDDNVDVPGLQIEYGGDIFYAFEMPASEALGVLAAVIILLVAFGSVLAMGLPIAIALAGLMTAFALIAIASNGIPMPDFTPAQAAMIGLGVGIDYALFIVTRYREGLHAGLDPETATVDAVDSSGRAVMFAGITVIISLFGLFLVDLSFVRGIALACILAVLSMMIGTITLLPALLGFVRHRIEVTTYRGALGLLVPVVFAIPAIIFGSAPVAFLGLLLGLGLVLASFAVAPLRRQVPHRRAHTREETFWYRWSRFVQRRPWRALIGGLIPLLILAIPLFSIRLGFGDQGNYPKDETTRKAYDLLADGFGPGFNGPLIVLIQEPGGQPDPDRIDALLTTFNQTPGVAFATDGASLGPGGEAHTLTVFPTGAPQDESTVDLVHHLRDDVIPASGLDAKVGGFPAVNVDFSEYLRDRLPVIIGAVLILSFLLLMMVFRSLLVPLKAVFMNLLSIGAAYGVVVALFQWGWGLNLVGVDHGGPIESWVPMFLFAIVFGLSMDYEVFLLSRIKEEYDRTGDNATAVADGVTVTARVITAAALIMVCVFGSFVLGDDRQLKLFGLGMAVAVLLDATIVRMVLVPATMELLGDRNWWLPGWLDKLLPRIHVEGKHHSLPPGVDEDRVPEKV